MIICLYWNVAMGECYIYLTVSENLDYQWENCWLLTKMLNKMFYFYQNG